MKLASLLASTVVLFSGLNVQARMIVDQNGAEVLPGSVTVVSEVTGYPTTTTLKDSQSDLVCEITSESALPVGMNAFQKRWSEVIDGNTIGGGSEYSIGLDPIPAQSSFNTSIVVYCKSISGALINTEMVERTISRVLKIEWRVLSNQSN